MHSGFIIIDRKLLEWKWIDEPNALSLWVHLLLQANWKDGYFKGKLIPRGSLVTSIGTLAKSTGMSENTVRKYLELFENDGQVKRTATNKYTLIEIVWYSKYQYQIEDQIEEQFEDNRTKKQGNKYKRNYKRKDVLPKYMTEGENDGDSSDLGNTEYEEIRKLLDTK